MKERIKALEKNNEMLHIKVDRYKLRYSTILPIMDIKALINSLEKKLAKLNELDELDKLSVEVTEEYLKGAIDYLRLVTSKKDDEEMLLQKF